jgi:DNA-binding transcriptional regulator YiaG
MAKVIQKKAATLQQLERAEKEMTHLGARVQELRRQVRSASAPSSKVLTGADIKEFCRQTNLTLDIFTRLVGTSRRAVATWLAGNPPNRANERNLTELSRLFAALAEVVPTAQIGSWLETSNSAGRMRRGWKRSPECPPTSDRQVNP